MKKRTGALMVVAAFGAGAASQNVDYNKLKSVLPAAEEKTVDLRPDHDKQLTQGSRQNIKMLGGLPVMSATEVRERALKTDPERVAENIVERVGAYVLELRDRHDNKTLPDGVTVTSIGEAGVKPEHIDIEIAVPETVKPGSSMAYATYGRMRLSINEKISKFSNGVYGVSAHVDARDYQGSVDASTDTTPIGKSRIPSWTLGVDSKDLLFSDDDVTRVEQGIYAIEANYDAESVLGGLRQAVAELDRR